MDMIKILAGCLLSIIILAGCSGAKKGGGYGSDPNGQRAYRHFLAGDMDRAIDQYKRGYANARRTDNVHHAAAHLANIGRVYAELGRPDSAMLYFAKSYEDFSATGDAASAARSAAGLAVTAAATGDSETAGAWFDRSKSLSAQANSGNKRGELEHEHYYAVIRARIDLHLSSKINNDTELANAAAYYEKKKDLTTAATIQILLGNAKLAGGNCAQAEGYLQNALAAIDETREIYRRSAILLKLSKIKFCLGDSAAGKHLYDRAKDCAPRGATIPAMDEVSSCEGGCGGRVIQN